MKKALGIGVVIVMALSLIIAAMTMTPGQVAGTSTIFGDYAYNGGYFFIDLVEQAEGGHIAHIYGEFQYWPDKNDIHGNVTIVIMDTMGNQLEQHTGTMTYENGVLLIKDENGKIYYRYVAQTAKEAFWKGLVAVYEYEMHRNIKNWMRIQMNVVNPTATQVQNQTIIGYQAEIVPRDKFEQMNLGQFGLIGPFKYYIIKIPDPQSGIIVSVKFIVMYNNAVIFSQEIGVRPPQTTSTQ